MKNQIAHIQFWFKLNEKMQTNSCDLSNIEMKYYDNMLNQTLNYSTQSPVCMPSNKYNSNEQNYSLSEIKLDPIVVKEEKFENNCLESTRIDSNKTVDTNRQF